MSKHHHPSDDDARDHARDHEFDAELDEELDEHDRADQARFASETAFCPECGSEVHDSADVCSTCFTWIDGATTRAPITRRARREFRRIVIWILIGALLLSAGVFGFLRTQL